MPTIAVGQALIQGQQTLEVAGIGTAQLDTLILAELACNRDRAWLLAHQEMTIAAAQRRRFEDLITRRASRVPMAHLTGYKEFYGLKFKVSADVLSPRPESERLVELATMHTPKDAQLLDMGTGCGALAISIAKNRPDLKITATDISPSALNIARHNEIMHKVSIKFVQSDLFGSLKGKFNAVVANLPYLKDDAELTPEATLEPKIALNGGSDGLSIYRRFLAEVSAYLAPDAWVLVESDPWQQPELIRLAKAAGLVAAEQDYFTMAFKVPRPR